MKSDKCDKHNKKMFDLENMKIFVDYEISNIVTWNTAAFQYMEGLLFQLRQSATLFLDSI